MIRREVRWAVWFFALMLPGLAHAQQPPPPIPLHAHPSPLPTPVPITTNTAAPNQIQSDAYVGLLREAYQLVQQNKLDEALSKVNTAIVLNPQGLSGYVLRGTVYSEQKVYDKSAQDFQLALQMDPTNSTVKFDLAEISFVLKQYAAARPGFAGLQNDKNDDLRDLATYKVFLCDLFGGQPADAARELDAFNQAGSRPSYYFGNAAWDLFNHKPDEARGWLKSAAAIYLPQKNALYAASLISLGYLPLPPSTTK